MFEFGKIHNTIQEMKQLRIDIMGFSEMCWSCREQITVDDHLFYYYSNDEGKHHWKSVSIIIHKILQNHNDEMKSELININLIQLQGSTADNTKEEIEEIYAQLRIFIANMSNHEAATVETTSMQKLEKNTG